MGHQLIAMAGIGNMINFVAGNLRGRRGFRAVMRQAMVPVMLRGNAQHKQQKQKKCQQALYGLRLLQNETMLQK